MRQTRLPAFAAAMAIWGGVHAVAQTTRLAALGPPDEAISDRIKTSGSLLVGLQLGEASGVFRPSQIRLYLHPSVRSRSICFWLSSRDGRYRGTATYRVAADASPDPFLDFESSYLRGANLPVERLAARAFQSERCDEGASGPLVPSHIGAERSGGRVGALYAFINPGDARVTPRLVRSEPDSAPIEGARCERLDDGVSIVFSQRCRLDLPRGLRGGLAKLELVVTELTGDKVVRAFPVVLPDLE